MVFPVKTAIRTAEGRQKTMQREAKRGKTRTCNYLKLNRRRICASWYSYLEALYLVLS